MRDATGAFLREGVLAPPALARARASADDGDVASAALRLGLASEGAIVRALAKTYAYGGIDLSRSVVPCSNFEVIALATCRKGRLLPVTVQDRSVVLAMADPEDLAAADEARFITGREVLRHVAVAAAIGRVLDAIPQILRQGGTAWAGEAAPRLPDPRAGWAGVVTGAAQPGSAPDVPAGEPSFAAAAGAPVPGAPAPAGRQRIALVADDDRATRDLIARVLAAQGFGVLHAGDGGTALDLIRSARPDVAIVDAMMPVLHGFEVCRAVKGDPSLRHIPIVLCSAVYRGTVGSDTKAALGADGFVEKPFRVDELMRTVNEALAAGARVDDPLERERRERAAGQWRAGAKALAEGRADEAAALCRGAAQEDPFSAEAHYYLGQALSKQGFLFEAAAVFERATELRPDVDAAHQHLAETYERLGFVKSARSAWLRAVEACRDPQRKAAMLRRLTAMLSA